MDIVNRQADLLEILARASTAGRSLRKLAGELGAAPSTTHRLLQALTATGMVSQDPATLNYRLGAEVLRLAGAYLQRLSFVDLVIPYLDSLTAKTGLVSFSAIRDGHSIICTSVRAPRETTNFYVRVGKSLPIHASAAAKALVYDVEPHSLAEMISNADQLTTKTRTKLAEIIADLKAGSLKGYWECDEELEPGVWAIAAPICASSGQPVVSLSILCQSAHLGGKEEQLAAEVKAIAQKASTEIGDLLLSGEVLEVR